MLKTRKLISLLLVVAMMLSVFSVAIVSASAADGDTATIIADGETYTFHEGDTIRYRAYMDVTPISTASDGRINAVKGITSYNGTSLSIVGAPDCKQVLSKYVLVNEPSLGRIVYEDNEINEGVGFVFDAQSAPLIEIVFKINDAGTEPVTITNQIETLSDLIDDIPVPYIQGGEIKTAGQPGPAYKSTLELVECPHPDEPTVAPTEAPTEAPEQPTTASDKAIVYVSGQDGEVETKEFNVGDTFYVYTTLNASQINDGKIGSLNARQLYTNSVVKLIDEYTEEDGILDLENVFPITKYNTMASGHHTDLTDDDEYHDPTRGAIFYNASIPGYRGFSFDDNDDIMIKSHYQITAPGEAFITNAIKTLAMSDKDLTMIVDEFEVLNPNFNFRFHSSFYWPESSKPTEGETVAPTEAETEAPTEAPIPTEAPTEAPVPTEAPTEPAPEDTYIVAGNATDIFGTSWNGNDANNTMTKGDDGIYTREYTVDKAMKDVQLKAVKNGTTWIGDETGNNVTFNLTGPGTFTC